MFVVQTNDIANLKNMPVINKRGVGSEDDKNGGAFNFGDKVGAAGLPVMCEGISRPSGEGQSQQAEFCKICYEAEPDAAFIPCGHNFACVKCAERCECCPVCRIPFDDIIKIYKN